jgi:hypothetical protein
LLCPVEPPVHFAVVDSRGRLSVQGVQFKISKLALGTGNLPTKCPSG